MSEKHVRDILTGPREVCGKAVENLAGKIIAASSWMFFVADGALPLFNEYPAGDQRKDLL